MKTESRLSPRLAIVATGIVTIAIAVILGLQSLTSAAEAPTPTLMASAVVISGESIEPSEGDIESEINPDEPTKDAETVKPAADISADDTQTLEQPTSSFTRELPPTNTPRSVTVSSVTATPMPLDEVTPIPAAQASSTLTTIPTPTPTSRPQLIPTLAVTETITIASTAIPKPVPTFVVPPGTTNILLLGSDIDLDKGVGRTDTMIIVAINRDGPTASMVSIPRDLYVFIPGWTMNRINTALSRGSSANYPGGAISQLKDTILYNFGVPIHYYAQVDFGGFKQAVDLLGGIDVAVSCQLRDWRLKSPDLNPEVENNWEMFTLKPGVYHMDGDMALWYARSRRTTSDFDRGRRQQQLLQAMLNQGVDLGLITQFPEIWGTYQDSVKTDMDIGRMLQLASLAPAVRENGVQHLYLVGEQLQPWTVPGSGAAVQLPVWDKMEDTFTRLFLPPALNRAARPPITVEIINSTDNEDLALLAADNLEWYGFEPIVNETGVEAQNTTTIEYFAQNFKGSFDWLISWILDKRKADIQLVEDTPYQYDYRVILGKDYDPCRPQLFAPQIFVGE